jgi:hypothetical protein
MKRDKAVAGILPEALEIKRKQVERAVDLPVVIREIKTPDAHFRGRLRKLKDHLILEYQVAQPGYFWEVETIEELLLLALAGKTKVILREE